MEEPIEDHGKTLLSWSFPEFVAHQRSRTWYILAILAILGALVFSIFTTNPLFAVIIVITAIIIVFRNRRAPADIPFAITEDGIEVGKVFYRYDALTAFWIIYEPPEVKRLYMSFRNTLRTNLSVSLENENPLKVREILLEYVEENLEHENESLSDAFQRVFKL
ncbi:MAG: hypothetical protein WC289_00965 [Patescibacteria group bacterium]|jgi:hypothetical protein